MNTDLTPRERESLNHRAQQLQRFNSNEAPRTLLILSAAHLLESLCGGAVRAAWTILRFSVRCRWAMFKSDAYRFWMLRVRRVSEREYMRAVGFSDEAIDQLERVGDGAI